MPKSKLEKEFQLDEDENTIIVPVKSLPEVSQSTIKQKVKREMSEKQKANLEKLVQANKDKWAKQRADREKAQKDAEEQLKKETEEKLKAGTHVKMKIKPKQVKPRQHKPISKRVPNEVYSDEDEETETDFTETEDDTDMEDYKTKKRSVRREVKKNLKTLQKIDEVLTTQNQNPYLGTLLSRWK